MKKMAMIREVSSLASGTLANLFGSANYEVIDQNLEKWVEWILYQDDAKDWNSWLDCWDNYRIGDVLSRQMVLDLIAERLANFCNESLAELFNDNFARPDEFLLYKDAAFRLSRE